jgi:hypothetical protein
VDLLTHLHERKVTQASILMVVPVQGSHADKRCGVQDPAKPYIKDDGGTLGPPGTLTGNRSGQAALRREQQEHLVKQSL